MQASLASGADILALPELDQKLWVALAMPTRDVAIDPATMDLLDPDKDHRVRVPDILDAVKWIGATWKSADDLLKSSDQVALAAIKDPAVASAARRILADAGKADGFFKEVDEVATWLGKAEAASSLGADTAKAADALAVVRAKIEDYFARAALAAFDPRATAGVNGQDADFIALGAKALSRSAEDIAKLPLARIEAGRPLPLTVGVNPAWAGPLATFVAHAVTPVLGARDVLTSDDFAKVIDKLAPYLAWRDAQPATGAAKLDPALITTLATGDARAKIAALIIDDKALAGDYDAIASVEKLCRLQRDFGKILRNFVNFSDFYDGGKRDGVFLAGTLLCALNCSATARARRCRRRTWRIATASAAAPPARSPRCSPTATPTTSSSAATASSTIATARTGTRRSPRSSPTRSACARRSGRRTRSWSG